MVLIGGGEKKGREGDRLDRGGGAWWGGLEKNVASPTVGGFEVFADCQRGKS